MRVFFIIYHDNNNDDTRFPIALCRVEISGNVLSGWTPVLEGFTSKHFFISIDRIKAIEIWETVEGSHE